MCPILSLSMYRLQRVVAVCIDLLYICDEKAIRECWKQAIHTTMALSIPICRPSFTGALCCFIQFSSSSLLYNVKMRNRERLGYPSNKTVIKADVAEILRLRLSLLLPA